MVTGKGVISKREFLIRQEEKLRKTLPAHGSEFEGNGIVHFQRFDNQREGAEPVAYCLLTIQNGKYALAVTGKEGLKCFLDKESRELLYHAYPHFRFQGGSCHIARIMITGKSNTGSSMKCRILQ